MRLKAGDERGVSNLRFGYDHDTGCIFIEAVHNAGAYHAANAGKAVAAMIEQRVHQRTRPCASCRVNHHARGLVDDDEVLILKQNIERDVSLAGASRLRGPAW